MNKKIIGVFDSGIGGLTVFKQLLNIDCQKLIYIADTANLPYGNKSKEQLLSYAQHIINFLVQEQCQIIIIACHTISSTIAYELSCLYPEITFITMLDLVVPRAIQATKSGIIGIIATQATIAAQAHKHALLKFNNYLTIIEQACPLLVPLLERNPIDTKTLQQTLEDYLGVMRTIDTLILGCTHYAWLKKEIVAILGNHIQLISAEDTIVNSMQLNNDTSNSNIPLIACYVTGNDAQQFKEKARYLGNIAFNEVVCVDLAKY